MDFTQILGLARAWPIITIIVPFISYFLSGNTDFIILFVCGILNDGLNHILKYKIFKPLMGNKKYSIVGSGARPLGAKNCGLFVTKTGKVPIWSYGMPSGHSQNAAFFSGYVISYLLDSTIPYPIRTLGIILFTCIELGIMYSRVYLKCHTFQQTIIGALIGLILGKTLYEKKDQIKTIFNL